MKKLTLSLLSLLCMSAAYAAPVDKARAAQAAVQHLSGITGKSFTVKQVTNVPGQYYIVNLAPQGWAIVAADDNARPIIGYNDRGSLSINNMPDNMRGWLDIKGATIKKIATELKVKDTEWNHIGVARSRATGVDTEPLIKVSWNQPSPFNAAVAAATGNKDVLVGCVAVAMSQAMSVQRYPDKFSDLATYTCKYGQLTVNGDAESPYDWDAILSGSNRYSEASRLMYHAGVSVSMNYGTEGSGIPSNEVYRITNALTKHFGYANVRYLWRDKYTGDWEQLLVNELNAGRAIVYNAVDTKGRYGHSFNIDGYHAKDGYFHVNWGWGGAGSGDGFMSIDNLSEPSMQMNYSDGHVAVIGIGAPNRAIFSIDVPNTQIEANMPAGTVFSELLVNNAKPTSIHTFKLQGKYIEQTSSFAEVPFVVETGADGTVYLKTTRPLTSADNGMPVTITVTESNTKTSMTSGFIFEIIPERTLEEGTSVKFDRASEAFAITTKHNSTYTLTGADGSAIISGTLTQMPTIHFTKSQLKDGVNNLEIKWNGKTKSLKIKK